MITIFSCPKPFTDPHISLIQRNAIRSWMALGAGVEVILVGNEPGIEEAARELGCQHVADVQRNEFQTPLLNDVFRLAERLAPHDLLCYANADIILMGDFLTAVETVGRAKERFLLGGRVWNIDLRTTIDFAQHWQVQLRSDVQQTGVLRPLTSCDYFVFRKGLWGELPPLIIGRCFFDNALLYRARTSGAQLIDASHSILAIHQNHSYATTVGDSNYLTNPEALRNIDLAGGHDKLYTWGQATHLIRENRIERSWWGTVDPSRQRLRRNVWYPLLKVTGPARHRLGLRATLFQSDRLEEKR